MGDPLPQAFSDSLRTASKASLEVHHIAESNTRGGLSENSNPESSKVQGDIQDGVSGLAAFLFQRAALPMQVSSASSIPNRTLAATQDSASLEDVSTEEATQPVIAFRPETPSEVQAVAAQAGTFKASAVLASHDQLSWSGFQSASQRAVASVHRRQDSVALTPSSEFNPLLVVDATAVQVPQALQRSSMGGAVYCDERSSLSDDFLNAHLNPVSSRFAGTASTAISTAPSNLLRNPVPITVASRVRTSTASSVLMPVPIPLPEAESKLSLTAASDAGSASVAGLVAGGERTSYLTRAVYPDPNPQSNVAPNVISTGASNAAPTLDSLTGSTVGSAQIPTSVFASAMALSPAPNPVAASGQTETPGALADSISKPQTSFAATAISAPDFAGAPAPVANASLGKSQILATSGENPVSKAQSSVVSGFTSCAVPEVLPQTGAFTAPCNAAEVIQNPAPGVVPGAVPSVLSPIAGLPQNPNHVPSESPKAVPSVPAQNELSPVRPWMAQLISQTVAPGYSPMIALSDTTGVSIGQLLPPSETAPTTQGGGVTAIGLGRVTGKDASLAGASSTTPANSAEDGGDAAGLKMRATSGPGQPRIKEGLQDAPPSGSQSQGAGSMPGAASTQSQLDPANRTLAAIPHTVSVGSVSAGQVLPAAPASATDLGHGAKMPETTSTAPATPPVALPVINTAKLIQTMGQSEMRVGMHSNEFGNISITTSSVRDLVSAQISLDHGELAKAIAMHLPEMQARLGGNSAMDVRIDMNGQAAGTSGGMPNGSADESRNAKQQTASAAAGGLRESVAERPFLTAVSAKTTSSGRLDARLDIRV